MKVFLGFVTGVVVGIVIVNRYGRIKTKEDIVIQSTVPAEVINDTKKE